MRYTDSIYGATSFDDPVVLALLNSEAILRLQEVLQHGITAILGMTAPITRYEHSVGTMILVCRLGGSPREQIAALLHDVSHTAFSHVVDFVFTKPDWQSYHEWKRREYLEASDIPSVLQKSGLNWTDFLDDERFPLLEQPSPRLCADRVDYFLRDARTLNILAEAETDWAWRHLIPKDDRMAVDNIDVARLLGYKYIETDEALWSNPTMILMYELTANAIRISLERGVISEADLWDTDAKVWKKMHQSGNPEVASAVALVSRRPSFIIDSVNPTLQLRPKIRTLDPDIVTAQGLRPLTEIDSQFQRHREDYMRRRSPALSLRLVADC